MTTLATFVRRHPARTYFALTFAISWGGALLAIGRSGAMTGTTPASDPRFVFALIAMLAGPSVTGLVLTALATGRAGVREYVSRALRWRVGARWYAVALLTAPAAMIATLLALSLTSRAFLPGIFTSGDKISLLAISTAVGVSAGIFEELGWTGFAIPALRRRHSVLATGLIVGVWWSAWHLLPNLWSSRAAAGELPMQLHLTSIAVGIFVGYLTAFRVLMVWVYDRTESVLAGIVMHISLTTSLLVLNPLAMTGARLAAYSFALAGVLWIVVASVAISDRLHVVPDMPASRAA
jgi:membrane protease YdiL (CAAX protease family)